MHITSLGRAGIAALAPMALAGAASAHNHVTVDTVSGAFGDQILIRAGYLATESSFSIAGGISSLHSSFSLRRFRDGWSQNSTMQKNTGNSHAM